MREFAFRLFDLRANILTRFGFDIVLRQTVFVAASGKNIIKKFIVPILTAEAIIAARRQHGNFLHIAALIVWRHGHFDNGDIEGAAAEIVDKNGAILLELSSAIAQSCRGRLIDQRQHIEPRQFTSLFGGGTFFEPEIRRDGDDNIIDGAALRLDDIFQTREYQSADLDGGISFAVESVGAACCLTDLTLDELHHAVAVGLDIFFSGLPDDDIIFILEEDDGRESI